MFIAKFSVKKMEAVMLFMAVISLGLFIYLGYALISPEKF